MAEEIPGPDTGTSPAETAPEPALYEPNPRQQICLAKWSTRFWAWLVDFILVILFLNIVRGLILPLWPIPLYLDFSHWEPLEFTFQTFFFFLYWTVMEGYRGQSIGKMVMNLKVVNRDGTKIHYGAAAIESFGKAFLLPLDCLIGWLGMPETKLRVFNRISNTIVIKTDYKEPEGVVYVKEKE
ncbi:MAG TPA: RDD family protein [Methanoregula sp.]|nr:RDD family protein [Methanoregula sp.]